MLRLLNKIAKRLLQFTRDPEYRSVLLWRIRLWFIKTIAKDIDYIGTNFGEETYFFFLRDSVITPYSLVNKGFSKEEFHKALNLLKKNGLKSDGIFFDIGANIGTEAVYALKYGNWEKAYCFEPVSSNIKLMRSNLVANGVYERARIIPKALSNTSGTTQISLSMTNTGDHKIAHEQEKRSGKFQSVDLITLDQFISEENINVSDISLLWMDVQGHEPKVLAGASKVLNKKVPLYLEFTPGELKQRGDFDFFIDLLSTHYRFFYDMKEQTQIAHPISELRSLADKYSTPLLPLTDLLVF